MTDKNGIEIQTGMVVEITGAYFKSDNGFYYVEHSPGDPGWCGSDHSLRKISKTGKISKAVRNICFWPIGVFVSDRVKAAEAKRWNEEHATIEVKALANMAEVEAHFREEAAQMEVQAQRARMYHGEECSTAKNFEAIQKHCEAVADRIRG